MPIDGASADEAAMMRSARKRGETNAQALQRVVARRALQSPDYAIAFALLELADAVRDAAAQTTSTLDHHLHELVSAVEMAGA